MLVSRSKLIRTFAQNLKEAYDNGTDIITCFLWYVGFIVKYGGKDLKTLIWWQIEDMIAAIYNDKIDYRLETLEVIWIRSRRSGKTMCATILAVFYVLIGKRVRWFSPGKDQMRAAKMWFTQNPFFLRFKDVEHEVYIIKEVHTLVWNVLKSPQAVKGDEADCNFYDEGGDVEKELKLYENYEETRPMLANSDFGHMLHFTTPARGTAVFEAKENLEQLEITLDTKLIFTRDYTWCPWTKKKRALAEAARHPEDPFWFAKNYLCMWVVYGGQMFHNYYDIRATLDSTDPMYETLQYFKQNWERLKGNATHGGVDWHQPKVGHYLGIALFLDQYALAFEEHIFHDLSYLKEWDHRIDIELEAGDQFERTNMFTIDALQLGVQARLYGWKNDFDKMERVRRLLNRKIIVDRLECPQLWKNLQECAYDKKKPHPAMAKTQDQHGIDWFLHAVHIADGQIYVKQQKAQTKTIREMQNALRI